MSITEIIIAIEPSNTVFKVNTKFLHGFKHLTFNICCRNDLADYLVISSLLLREINGYTICRVTAGPNISNNLFSKINYICNQYNNGVNVANISDAFGIVLNRTKDDIDVIMRENILSITDTFMRNRSNVQPAGNSVGNSAGNSPVNSAVNNIFQNVVAGNINRDVWQSLIRNLGESLFSLAASNANTSNANTSNANTSNANTSSNIHHQPTESPFETFIRNVRDRLDVVNTEISTDSMIDDDDREVYIYNQNSNNTPIVQTPRHQTRQSDDQLTHNQPNYARQSDDQLTHNQPNHARQSDDQLTHNQPNHARQSDDQLTHNQPNQTSFTLSFIVHCAKLINNRILNNKTLHPNFRKHTLSNYKKIKNYLISVLHVDMNYGDIKLFMNEIIKINPNVNAV